MVLLWPEMMDHELRKRTTEKNKTKQNKRNYKNKRRKGSATTSLLLPFVLWRVAAAPCVGGVNDSRRASMERIQTNRDIFCFKFDDRFLLRAVPAFVPTLTGRKGWTMASNIPKPADAPFNHGVGSTTIREQDQEGVSIIYELLPVPIHSMHAVSGVHFIIDRALRPSTKKRFPRPKNLETSSRKLADNRYVSTNEKEEKEKKNFS